MYIGYIDMSDSDSRLIGCVKWFNSKTGYGFITICGEERDIFVHYSNVKVDGLQYTYLVQGEYVEFELAETNGENEKYSHHAVNISGIKGGPIMCKTRFQNRQYSQTDDSEEEVRRPVVLRREPVRINVRPTRLARSSSITDDVDMDREGFKKVVRKRPLTKKSAGTSSSV
jgi:CspA family cold shock protein